MLHLAGRVALGVEIGDLLELERAFERDGVEDAPSQIERISGVGQQLGPLGKHRVVGQECSLDRLREPLELGHQHAVAGVGQSARRPKPEGDQDHGDELGGEGLGRRDADLGPGLGENLSVGQAPGGRAADVAHRRQQRS